MSSTSESTPQQAGKPATVKEALALIANDIESHGHYKTPSFELPTEQRDLLWDPLLRPDGKCCLLINPTRKALRMYNDDLLLLEEIEAEMARRIKANTGDLIGLAKYSDVTPTDELLEMLRADPTPEEPGEDRPDWALEGFGSLQEAENVWQAEAEDRASEQPKLAVRGAHSAFGFVPDLRIKPGANAMETQVFVGEVEITNALTSVTLHYDAHSAKDVMLTLVGRAKVITDDD